MSPVQNGKFYVIFLPATRAVDRYQQGRVMSSVLFLGIWPEGEFIFYNHTHTTHMVGFEGWLGCFFRLKSLNLTVFLHKKDVMHSSGILFIALQIY